MAVSLRSKVKAQQEEPIGLQGILWKRRIKGSAGVGLFLFAGGQRKKFELLNSEPSVSYLMEALIRQLLEKVGSAEGGMAQAVSGSSPGGRRAACGE